MKSAVIDLQRLWFIELFLFIIEESTHQEEKMFKNEDCWNWKFKHSWIPSILILKNTTRWNKLISGRRNNFHVVNKRSQAAWKIVDFFVAILPEVIFVIEQKWLKWHHNIDEVPFFTKDNLVPYITSNPCIFSYSNPEIKCLCSLALT